MLGEVARRELGRVLEDADGQHERGAARQPQREGRDVAEAGRVDMDHDAIDRRRGQRQWAPAGGARREDKEAGIAAAIRRPGSLNERWRMRP